MNKVRLQKIISEAGICSRRKAEALLIAKRVTINGKKAELGDKADPNVDEIYVDDYKVQNILQETVILLNKPIGVISTCNDPQGRITVLDLLPEERRKGLYPVGRLDLDSRGAILLTNNGDLTLKLTHPSYSHSKTYRVIVEGLPSSHTLKKWREGVMLNGKRTLKASIKFIQSNQSKSMLEVILREGRNRQIRKVGALLGHPVIDLQRIAIGNIQLENLKEGNWRELNKNELHLLKGMHEIINE